MSQWPATRASLVLAALFSIGWKLSRQRGTSHLILKRDGKTYVWAFHNNVEIGPRMLARIAKHTGLKPGDL